MRSFWPGILLLSLVLAAGRAQPAAAADTYYCSLRFPPAQRPALYCEIGSNGLRYAATPSGLKSAPWIKSSRSDAQKERRAAYSTVEFSEITLPIKLAKAPAVKAVFRLHGFSETAEKNSTGEAFLIAEFHLLKKAADGGTWNYTISAAESVTAGRGLARSPVFDIPLLNNLKLELEPQVEAKTIAIGMQLKDDKVNIDDVTKNGKPVACTLKIYDANNKLFKSVKGDLAKFGFG